MARLAWTRRHPGCLVGVHAGDGLAPFRRKVIALADAELVAHGRFDDELIIRCEPVHFSLRYIADVLVQIDIRADARDGGGTGDTTFVVINISSFFS